MIDTAIILAGGLGTRLRPLTNDTPKPLVPILGKPILHHGILQLKKHGINNIIISTGYKGDKIEKYFGDGSSLGVNISYCVEKEPLGTGGAIKEAAKNITNPFIALNGDNLADYNFTRLIKQHQENATPITLALFPVEDVTQFGIADLEGDIIKQFIEKPTAEEAPSNLNNAGAYIIEPNTLNMLPEGKSSIERDCFEKLAPLGKLGSYKHEGQWFPTDNIERFSNACKNYNPNHNLTGKKVIIADVDETICETCQEISPKMANTINSLISKGYQFAFISGTHCKELQRMVSSKVTKPHHLLGATGTNYVFMQDNIPEERYKNSFSIEEKQEIITAFEKMNQHFNIIPITLDQIQDRDSQITHSAIGRSAPIELKKAYDPDGKKRQEWATWLEQHIDLDKFSIKIGGTTSLDVTQKGLDKETGIKTFAEHQNIPLKQILFFGDKIYPGGNDYPASKIVDSISVKSPEETLNHLQYLDRLTPLTDNRPWGNFKQFTHNEMSTVKILEVLPNKRLSLQSHEGREELWVALEDGPIVEVGEVKKTLKKGEMIFIPKQTKHRLSAENKTRVLEVSFGKFDENDITRYEDDFGRLQ